MPCGGCRPDLTLLPVHQYVRAYFKEHWHDGLAGGAHELHTYYRKRDGVQVPQPHENRWSGCIIAILSQHASLTLGHRTTE